MKYYVITSVLQGIQYKELQPGVDFTGAVVYFINLESKNDTDEYYDASDVFSDYDEALQFFCQKCEESLEYHQEQIQAIKRISHSYGSNKN